MNAKIYSIMTLFLQLQPLGEDLKVQVITAIMVKRMRIAASTTEVSGLIQLKICVIQMQPATLC